MRVKHYSLRTEKIYIGWMRRFILANAKRHPREMGAAEVEAFLSLLAVQGKVAASTQNQALSALLFLYRVVLAEANGSPMALASHYAKCGTRGPRVHPDHYRYILEFHDRTYGTEEARSLRAVYREYRSTLEDTPSWTAAWASPVEWETYRSYVSHMDQEELEKKRGGLAAGNAAARPVDPQLAGLPCQYAFEVAEIDHYLADIFVVVAKTKRKIYCARPWITLMIDVFSGCVLAMWIGLSAPSRRSCAMVIRDCIRRHGRIPNCLRLDNGSEFHSVYLDTLIAYLPSLVETAFG